ncbi:hypothetical protein FRC02_004741 [Tulasnella sp. 418]|nr:hypothetical protein FRC02_004741 [Tulasnella sp. 418]
MIFYIVANDAYLRNIYRQKSLFNLIKVCRRWYHIIQKTKSFRAFLDSSLSLKTNQCLIEKSGSYPLTISGCWLSEDFMKLVNSQLRRVVLIAFTADVAALRRYSRTLKLHLFSPSSA